MTDVIVENDLDFCARSALLTSVDRALTELHQKVVDMIKYHTLMVSGANGVDISVYATILIKLALELFLPERLARAESVSIEIKGRAVRVLVERILKILPVDALNDLDEYHPELYQSIIKGWRPGVECRSYYTIKEHRPL